LIAGAFLFCTKYTAYVIVLIMGVVGAGKTTVLVERYLHILQEHKLSIDQIVAITFTNRAANEMRERFFMPVLAGTLVERAKKLLELCPARTIKEMSFDLGYESPRSFARAIKRALKARRVRAVEEIKNIDKALSGRSK